MACDLTTTQEAACTSGIGKLDNRIQLLKIIAQLLCEISEGGGGGGNVTKFDSGNVTLDNVTTKYIIPHPLGAIPPMVNVVLVCIGADGGVNASVGDEIDADNLFSNANLAPAFTIKRTSANIIVSVISSLVGSEGSFSIIPDGGGSTQSPTSFNNFALKAYAWL